MGNTTSTAQVEKVLNFLRTGKQLTVREATKRLGVTRLSARIYDLRDAGYTIYTNKKRVKAGPSRGEVVTAYRLDNSQQF